MFFCSYINKSLQPLQLLSTDVFNQQKNFGVDSEKRSSQLIPVYNSDITSSTPSTQRSVISLASSLSGRVDITLSGPQQRAFPAPVPVRGIRFDGPCTGYGSVVPPIFCTPSGLSSMPSPCSAGQQELNFRTNPCHLSRHETGDSQCLCNPLEQNVNNSTTQTNHKPEHKLDSVEGQGHFCPATDQNSSSSFSNGGASHLNSFGHGSLRGSNGNTNPAAAVLRAAAAEGKNEEGVFSYEGHSQRSIQREAALTKFRLKRKDRCYEKKVLLHSAFNYIDLVISWANA